MTNEAELLIEIGCEELPVEDQLSLQEQLKTDFAFYLSEAQLKHSEPQVFTTPRRLVVYCSYVEEKQESVSRTVTGPPYKVAFDNDGNPTQAALKFAGTYETTVEQLTTIESKKGRYLAFKQVITGEDTVKLLPNVLQKLLFQLNFKKSMYWEESKFTFSRPIRWIVALYRNEIVPFSIAEVTSSNITRGHRFLGESYIVVRSWEEYLRVLQENFVMVNNHSRKLLILKQMQEGLFRLNAKVREDEELLQYAVHSVENPQVIVCDFPIQFLFLPEELIITCLKVHQKAFVLEDTHGKLLPYFMVVANTDKDDMGIIKNGNEKIAIARLKDASFFWEEDKKTSLRKFKLVMPKIIFQAGKGTLADKINRMVNLVKYLAPLISLDSTEQLLAAEAAELCKCDLASKTVGEFPSLQGKLGGLLAKEEKISKEIAKAIYEHYMPVTFNDPVPSSRMAALLSLADKFDNLCIGFAHGLELSGSKDPYGLRRQAVTFCRLLIEFPFFISLSKLVENYGQSMKLRTKNNKWQEELREFIIIKFKSIAEQNNYRYDIINAILAAQQDDLHDAWLRLEAINEVSREENFEQLVKAFKRVNNILRGQKQQHIIDTSLFKQDDEDALYQAWLVLQEEWRVYLRLKSYKNAFKALLSMCVPINNLFDNVLVMAEDEVVRNNRVAILHNINNTFLKLLDLSEIVISGRES